MQGLAFSLATLIADVWWVCSVAYPAPVLNDLIRGVFPKRHQTTLQSEQCSCEDCDVSTRDMLACDHCLNIA